MDWPRARTTRPRFVEILTRVCVCARARLSPALRTRSVRLTEEGRIVYEWSAGAGSNNVSSEQAGLADGKWHSVEVVRDGAPSILFVDNTVRLAGATVAVACVAATAAARSLRLPPPCCCADRHVDRTNGISSVDTRPALHWRRGQGFGFGHFGGCLRTSSWWASSRRREIDLTDPIDASGVTACPHSDRGRRGGAMSATRRYPL